MRRVIETRKRGSVGYCEFWREDIVELFEFMKLLANTSITIKSGEYEFDSLDEFFSSVGPRVRSLEFNCANPYISVELDPENPTFYVDDDDHFELLFSKLENFFAPRRSTFLKLQCWALAAAVPLTFGALAWSVGHFFKLNWATGIAILGLAIAAGVQGGQALFKIASNEGRVVLRNHSKLKAQFSAEERRRENLNKLVFLLAGSVLGAILTTVARLIWAAP